MIKVFGLSEIDIAEQKTTFGVNPKNGACPFSHAVSGLNIGSFALWIIFVGSFLSKIAKPRLYWRLYPGFGEG